MYRVSKSFNTAEGCKWVTNSEKEKYKFGWGYRTLTLEGNIPRSDEVCELFSMDIDGFSS
jgi:hypothetical protein